MVAFVPGDHGGWEQKWDVRALNAPGIPCFFDPSDGALTVPSGRNQYLIIIFIVATVSFAIFGALTRILIGVPKSVFLIILAMIIWAIGGWIFVGARSAVIGLVVLSVALTTAQGTYPLAFVFGCSALALALFLFGKNSATDDEPARQIKWKQR